METVQMLCTLRVVDSFLDVFASDLLSRLFAKFCTDIINVDTHTEVGSHWLAIHFRAKSTGENYFDSYGIVTLVPVILEFIRLNYTTWDDKGGKLQGLKSDVCSKYCCLLALYMDLATLQTIYCALQRL